MNGITPTVFVIYEPVEIREALSQRLASGGYHVRSFRSAERFLEEQDTETTGCLLLDVVLPGLNGLELQRALAGSKFLRPIIFLTDRGDVEITVQAMKAGAIDFLTRKVDDAQLFGAVDRALRRDSEERRQRAIDRVIEQRFKALTLRERQVMQLVVFGRINKQIAAHLGRVEKTVKVHRARVMAKMGARSVAELVHLAARVGIAMDPMPRISSPASAEYRDSPRYVVLTDRRYTSTIPAIAAGLREQGQ